MMMATRWQHLTRARKPLMLDTNYQIETPENIDIDIQARHSSARALAI